VALNISIHIVSTNVCTMFPQRKLKTKTWTDW